MTDAVSRKIFVSYKYKDKNVRPLDGYTPNEDTNFYYTPRHYVDKIIDIVGAEHIYKGEISGEDASHLTDDTIDSKLKAKIFDSSATIVLISPNMKDPTISEGEQWVPNEISYSLRYKTRGDRTSDANGMLAVVLPDANGSHDYAVVQKECGVRSWQTNTFFKIISENMFNRQNKNHTPCESCSSYHHHGDDHSYIHPVKWDEFIANYNTYIEHAIALKNKKHEFVLTKVHE